MVPKLTAEQRRAALDKGMQIRLKREACTGLGYIQREGLIKALGGGCRE